MLVSYKYTYLVVTSLFFIFWLVLYILRKDLRKEMWTMSILVAVGSIVGAFWWTVDWWQPLTITNTRVGIEDFFLGFTNGGIVAVLYEEIFKRRLQKRRGAHKNPNSILLVLSTFILVVIGSWWFHLTSFWGTIFALLAIGCIVVFLRKDLWQDAVLSGFVVSILFLPFYWVAIFLSPGIIDNVWLFDYLTGIKITGVPLEDIVFYFLLGFAVGPFYEYWKSERLRKLK